MRKIKKNDFWLCPKHKTGVKLDVEKKEAYCQFCGEIKEVSLYSAAVTLEPFKWK